MRAARLSAIPHVQPEDNLSVRRGSERRALSLEGGFERPATVRHSVVDDNDPGRLSDHECCPGHRGRFTRSVAGTLFRHATISISPMNVRAKNASTGMRQERSAIRATLEVWKPERTNSCPQPSCARSHSDNCRADSIFTAPYSESLPRARA